MGTKAALSLVAFLAFAVTASPAAAQTKYDPGATDKEIKVGNIVPYTGKFAQYGVNGGAEAAYFRMINDRGGINGRRINIISLDSASDTSKARALAQQLVEQEKVLLTVGIWGTPTNLAVRPYFNEKKVPQLFISAPESAFNDPAQFPWTMGFQATKRVEGQNYARHILAVKPAARIAILYADDPSGREWLLGVHDVLGDKAATMIVKEVSFVYSEPAALAPKVEALKATGADVFLNIAVGRFATEAIRHAYDIGWHPLQFIPNASISTEAFLDPAGLQKAKGVISNARSKLWLAPDARSDPGVRSFLDWMKIYNSGASLRDAENVYGYEVAQTLVEVLKKCGNDLTRANVMKQTASLDLELGMLRPGIKITTSPTD